MMCIVILFKLNSPAKKKEEGATGTLTLVWRLYRKVHMTCYCTSDGKE